MAERPDPDATLACKDHPRVTALAQCAHCHAPPLYTDLAMHDGVRTPTLRGVAKRRTDLAAAMMHPGVTVALSASEKSSLVAFLQAL